VATTHPARYTVRRGDTLITVADRFGVSVEELRKWNRLSSSTISPGRTITVAEPVKLAPGTRVRGKSSSHASSAKSSSHTSSASTHSSAKPSSKSGSKSSHAKSSSSKPKSPSTKSKSKAAR
jgi:membrane-bound lytic murein transglycosylase D